MDENSIYRAFGKVIAARRAAVGKTQEEVARQVGISRPSLANIERGNQRVFLHQILSFVDALGLDSAHEIVPDRTVVSDGQKRVRIQVSGAKYLSSDQHEMIDNIVGSVGASSAKVKL